MAAAASTQVAAFPSRCLNSPMNRLTASMCARLGAAGPVPNSV